MFLPLLVLCDLLLNRPTATCNLFVLHNDQKTKKTDTHTCLVPHDLKICTFQSQTQFFVSAFFFFSFNLLVYSFFETFSMVFSCSKQINGENILQNSESLFFLLRAFCVFVNIHDNRSQQVFFCTNGVMCRALWRHLTCLPYQFSIYEHLGGWQPWKVSTLTGLDLSTNMGLWLQRSFLEMPKMK